MRPLAVLLVLVLGLAGCASAGGPSVATSTALPSDATADVPSSTPTPPASVAPVAADGIVAGLPELVVTRSDATRTIAYGDGAALLALARELTGEDPAPNAWRFYGNTDLPGESYAFTGLRVDVPVDGAGGLPSEITVTAPSVGGIPVRTAEGIGVGSSRAEALAAGAQDGSDTDGDGTADFLLLGSIEVPGTVAFARPGEVGTWFGVLVMTGDVVSAVTLPINDYTPFS